MCRLLFNVVASDDDDDDAAVATVGFCGYFRCRLICFRFFEHAPIKHFSATFLNSYTHANIHKYAHTYTRFLLLLCVCVLVQKIIGCLLLNLPHLTFYNVRHECVSAVLVNFINVFCSFFFLFFFRGMNCVGKQKKRIKLEKKKQERTNVLPVFMESL